MNPAHTILTQKLLDTEDGHTTGITREEIKTLQAEIEAMQAAITETHDNIVFALVHHNLVGERCLCYRQS